MQRGELLDGRYRIVRQLGAGGFGSVFEAFDERIRRSVALKVITHAGGEDPAVAAARFAQEAITAGGLSNAHIVTIYDYGPAEHRGTTVLMLVMELVTGRSLREILDEGPMPPERAAGWTRQICDALGAAHRAGIVHRDIKPANIVVDEELDLVKVLDFGIATSAGAGASGLTVAGMVIGTFLYMAPERCLGKPAGPPSDLYAVGCVLHEMLTGRPAIGGDGAEAVTLLYQHVHQQPSAPSTQRPGIPAHLDRLVLELLAKEPEDRPADAGVVVALLAEAGAAPPPPAPAPAAAAAPVSAPVSGPVSIPAPAAAPSVPSVPSSAALTGPGTTTAIIGGSARTRLERASGEAEVIGRHGEAERARALCAQLVEESVETLGYLHRTTLDIRLQHAKWTGQAGQSQDARLLYSSLVEACGKVLGADHIDTLNARAALADWTARLGMGGDARKLYEGLISDYLRVLGSDHPDTRAAVAERDALR